MKNNWKDFFYFSKSERNGIFVLLLCSFLFLIIPFFFSFSPKTTATDFSVFQKEVDSFLSKTTEPQLEEEQKSNTLFFFDPNTLSVKKLRLLGLPDRVVNNLLNYRNKGGRFFAKEDLKKIYGMSSRDYQRLLPYISIAPKTKSPKSKQSPPKISPQSDTPSPLLQAFDPNTASQTELIALGISPKAAKTLLNFRNKGGTFRKKEDLKKVFGITAADYRTLEPFIQIEQAEQKSTKKTPAKPLVVDINQATAEDWQALKGIGPVYARRIIELREKLGGFSHLEQLKEVYGLPDSTFQNISPLLQESPITQKLPINLATVEDLKKHPYLNYRQANAIVNYRKNHGKFTQWEALKQVKALPQKTIMQIKPYLLFE